MLIFISGGVRSGKSSQAERMAVDYYNQQQAQALYYVATTKRNNDEEMTERIHLHQESRSELWTTIEEPYRLDERMREMLPSSVILIDCLTVWSSNVMFSENKTYDSMIERLSKVFQIAKNKNMTVIMVSNDLNEELPIPDDGVQSYVYSLEAVHKYVVKHCDEAIQTVAGCQIRWK
ncbi:bifunctional adenosylcobinamide kinase/adenosylcobinamide-phosphate guanylyltransferase [Bacillus massiliigorillae]|uniref:bifunctional adenosylcobinamide kinase/adenosylcobinamide-phosphate guanylyltransferase n=1 Tax=Bacillus massiliigorillae TaxID=1243664 RepID=UPI0003A952C8|nr:bifunctional adenosylcobinamide kinase/adenosylcobinamide-phosphate guanylyltransferase [Bacillus massiliigorillae]